MKLKRVTNSDPIERVSLSLHASVTSQLKAYQDFYKGNTGDEISLAQLVEEMTKSFMREDKAFQKFVSAKPAPAPVSAQ